MVDKVTFRLEFGGKVVDFLCVLETFDGKVLDLDWTRVIGTFNGVIVDFDFKIIVFSDQVPYQLNLLYSKTKISHP